MSTEQMMKALDEIKTRDYRLPNGKHKGQHTEDVDQEYLLWYVFNCKGIEKALYDHKPAPITGIFSIINSDFA
jgi:hypothetical protein